MQTETLETPQDTAKQFHGQSLMGVEIEMTISVGKTRLPLSDLVKLARDSVIQLDSRIEDPVDIYVGDRLIARGELEEAGDGSGQLNVRLVEISDLSEGL